MSDPDDRPRPQYGEYATPEEVAAITGRPAVSPPVPAPGPGARAPRTDAEPGTERPPHPELGPAARRALVWDRAVTVGLFAAGAWTVSGFVLDPHEFATRLDASARTTGFTGTVIDATVDTIGSVVGTVLVLMFTTALLATLLLRARVRLLFWIPLTGAALSALALVVGVGIAIAHVPGLLTHLSG